MDPHRFVSTLMRRLNRRRHRKRLDCIAHTKWSDKVRVVSSLFPAMSWILSVTTMAFVIALAVRAVNQCWPPERILQAADPTHGMRPRLAKSYSHAFRGRNHSPPASFHCDLNAILFIL